MTDNLSDDANSVSTAVIAEYSLVSEKIALQISPPTDLHRRKHDQRSKPHITPSFKKFVPSQTP